MRSPRSVTFAPIAIPWRSLKLAIDFFARVIAGFWPVMMVRSVIGGLEQLGVLGRPADTHVHDDLLELRYLVHVGVAEALHERRHDLRRGTFP